MTGRFEGRTVLVTGGSRGMGAEHVRGFVKEGASVAIADVLEDEGRALADELGDRTIFVRLDVTSLEQWESALATTRREIGDLTVLVNNAGIGGAPAPIVETDPSDWRRVLEVNLDGTFHGIRAAAPLIAANGGGAIVNVSSFAGLMGSPLLGAYAASKFAIRGLTKVAAMELGPVGIRVNSVHPGYVRTELLGPIPDDVTHGRLALERMGSVEDVTPVVLFAASDEARYVTGTELVVDGGWSNGEPSPLFVPPGADLPEEFPL